jgi:hypothetical protein
MTDNAARPPSEAAIATSGKERLGRRHKIFCRDTRTSRGIFFVTALRLVGRLAALGFMVGIAGGAGNLGRQPDGRDGIRAK